MYTTRAKLYMLDKSHAWKERGTGTLKINRHEASQATRMVMRSDAVLRVILNVQLFPGMQCDLDQERFIRIAAMEEGGLSHLALKLANASEAAALQEQLHAYIPPRSVETSA